MGAEPFVPTEVRGIGALRASAQHCRGCDLYERSTQTVFGEGKRRRPWLMLVGEQPGDAEDRAGHPFVGPAGSLLHRALKELGVEARSFYVTNAVKHFKWEPRGKARLHKTPSAREVAACRPWLMAEIAALRPHLIVCLGATAAHSLLGSSFRVLQHRGEIMPGPAGYEAMATVHPASVLRISDHAERDRAFELFVADLRIALDRVGAMSSGERASADEPLRASGTGDRRLHPEPGRDRPGEARVRC